uniref:Zinc finger protein 143 n=1 Tax=Clastoptera arizonana TaxID=38151 RepID=A0A1B6CLB0_9HEMI
MEVDDTTSIDSTSIILDDISGIESDSASLISVVPLSVLKSDNFGDYGEITSNDEGSIIRIPISGAAVITLADGSQAIIKNSVVETLNTGDTEETAIQNENSEPAVFEAHVIQLEGGALAYIHSQPQEGSQAVELQDGSTAYITLTQPVDACVLENEEIHVIESKRIPKNYMCAHEGCGRLYTSSNHLKVHERTHTGSRPYLCTFDGCSKAFATEYSRKAHLRIHTGEKPYKCTTPCCQKRFKTSGDLQKHIRTHTGERPFQCPFVGCNRSFTTSNIRKVHVRTHTGERPYVCTHPKCGRAFASATNYKNHIRIHSGEKPYFCTVADCNKRFTEYSSLYKHQMVHTQEKPYHCNVCGRHYRQSSTLTVHKRTAHGVIEAEDGTEIVLGNMFGNKKTEEFRI